MGKDHHHHHLNVCPASTGSTIVNVNFIFFQSGASLIVKNNVLRSFFKMSCQRYLGLPLKLLPAIVGIYVLLAAVFGGVKVTQSKVLLTDLFSNRNPFDCLAYVFI